MVEDKAVPLRFALEPGHSVNEAIAKGLAASECLGAVLMFHGGRFDTFKYVMPALSSDGLHVAWYSDTFEPDGPVVVDRACVIAGWRDESPFVHCHGIWQTRDGPRMGHMLASDTIVSEPIMITGIGTRSATFRASPDQETNFTLFEPTRVLDGRPEAGPRAILAKVRPNQDISLAVESICAQANIRAAKVHGIGSLNEVRFANDLYVESRATEVLIRNGEVSNREGSLVATLDLDVVDVNGKIYHGIIARADNPVCVTFELLIEELL
ncbi:PCC domain-containing protein [Microvirga rosea]|uniref:PCC domain-containing protein n=1 Tax=Microvirga rosea TaxID=2715425 RepID=UPI001D0BE262|nr:DUF296 domain-containing protein [Microvirga rosea]MCB8821067.1 DUF296 domain-containing protein [Microvirga rosea]